MLKTFFGKYGKDAALFVGVVLIAFFLRSYNLIKIPVFADEAIYIRWAQIMQAEPSLRFLPQSDGKQPLFMWSVIPLLKLFEDPLIAGRMVSVLCGIGTLTGIFVLTKLLFGSSKAALTSAIVYAISPFSLFFDRLAMADSMLSMFGVWVLVFATLTVKYVRLDTALIAGFSLGGALLTKTPALFFSLLLPFTLIIHEWPKKNKDKLGKLSVFFFLFTSTYLIGYAMYNILRLGTDFHMIAIRNKDYVYPLSHFIASPWDPFLPFIDRVKEYFLILGPSTLIPFFIFGVYRGLKTNLKKTALLLAWFIFPILVSAEFSKTMTARYVYFSVPYFCILASLAFLNIRKKTADLKHLFGKITFILFAVFVFHALSVDFKLLNSPQSAHLPRSERSGYLEEWTSGYGIREVSEYLKKEVKDLPTGRQVVVGTEGYFGTLPDGLQIYVNDTRQVTVIGVGLPIKDIPVSLEESKAAGNKTYMLVNDTRFVGDSGKLRLKLLSAYEKGVKPDGTREKLLFFEL